MTGGADLKSRTRRAARSGSRMVIAALTLAGVIITAASADAASVSLTWNAPTTSADGSPLTDLGSYRIYLGTATPSCPSASFLTVASSTSTPSTGQTVSTRVAALTAGATYFVRISAVDTTGNESSCSTAASGVAQADFSVTPAATTNFGSIAVGSSADATFTVQNTSTTSLTGTASVGAPYSIVSGGSFSLAAGASQVVTVRFRPTAAGTFAGNVNFAASGDTLSRVLTGTGTAVPTAALSVTTAGTGAGTVTSAPTGIACGSICSAAVPIGTPVTLTATAASGSSFMGWGGACNGTAACTWTMAANAAVTATFDTTRVDRPLQPAPVPVASTLSPATATAGSPALTLTVNGSGFVASSVVRWNGADRTTTVVSVTQLTATITTTDLASARSVPVTVFSPTPGGGTSNNVTFTVTAAPAAPTLTSLSPTSTTAASLSSTSATAASAALTLTVNGKHFVAASVVRWNGSDRTTTFVSASQLRAAITAGDLATARSVPVTVFTPAPGGGTSAVKSFTVSAPPAAPAPSTPPVLPAMPGNLSVSQTTTDASGVTFTIAWAGVGGATSYKWVAAFSDGTAVQQGAVTSASLQLRMPYHVSGAAAGGFVCVRSANAAGQSADQSCTAFAVPARPVSLPVPVASSLSPAGATSGSAGLTLTVNGSSFVASSVVRWNGADRPTTFISVTELRATIAAADLATARTVPVTVFTPTPGGGTSASRSFTVTTPPVVPAPLPSLPDTPSGLSVTPLAADASGTTFTVAWSTVSGAISYRYTAAFADGTATQQGTVAGLLSFQLRMPYHVSGAASGGFVCLRSVNGAGQSADQACAGLSVPARPVALPVPVAGSLSPASAVAGDAGFTLTVNGSGFGASSAVRWNGTARATTFASATQLSITLTAADLASPGSALVSVFTPAPGGGTSGTTTFTIAAPAPPPQAPSTPPATPGNPSVTLGATDAGGVTFTIAWGGVSGAASYRYVAAFSDGSGLQQGAVTSPSLQLRMPYHWSGSAFSGFVCIRSVNAAGQSADQSCSALNVPAR